MSAPGAENKDSLSEHFKHLREELHCPLCLDYFEDPVTLPCQHSLCRGCMPGLVRPAGTDKHKVECPLCRATAELSGTAEECVRNLPRNFQLASIVEKFRAAETEKKRSEEVAFQRQLEEQIERSRQDDQRRQQMEHRQIVDQSCGSVSAVSLPPCETCSSPGEIQCSRCNGHFCLECQQTHPHDDLDEQIASDPEQQHLEEKQRLLELDRDQTEALAAFQPTRQWHQQQAERLEELQRGHQDVMRQASEQHSPQHQPEDIPPEPYSWPFDQQQGQVYQQQNPLPSGYPYPGQQQQFQPNYPGPHQHAFSTPTSPTSQKNCSYCRFPAVKVCHHCRSYFCWQCFGALHDPQKQQYRDHNVGELAETLSNVLQLSPGSETSWSTGPPLTIPMIGLQESQPVKICPSPPTPTEKTYKLPFSCEIKGMGPGKHFVVRGKPFKQNLKRFHINLMCSGVLSNDIALHFNPRFASGKTVVRNARIGGKYGSEERRASTFPFAAGRPFKIDIICQLDKYEVLVDDKPFTTFAHRIKDLRSVKRFQITGDVEVSFIEGCA